MDVTRATLGAIGGAIAVTAMIACGPKTSSRGEVPAAARASEAPSPSPAASPSPSSSSSSSSSSASPESTSAPPPKPVRRPGAFANLDPDDDYVVGPPDPIDDCDGELARAGVTFHAATLAVHEQKKSKILCGAPQVVTYVRGPGKIAYSSPPLLTCGMALALASFERLAQDEAQAALGSPIVRIDHLGTYNCREMAAYPGWVSEHSYANAIDIAHFVLKDGRTIEVERDFDKGDDALGAPKTAGGRFLRVVSRRANDEDIFSHVLTPFFDALHKNHFHLDLARYRTDGTRPHA